MPGKRIYSEIRLVNGSTGDPSLFVDYPGRNNALLFDVGELGSVALERLSDLEAVFITHHHVDHFIGFDRIVRANIDADKVLSVYGPAGTIKKVYDRIKSYEYQYFPFQKIVLKVHDVLPDAIDSAVLECTRRFPAPEIEVSEWPGATIFENDDLCVEAVHTDHTVPCLAFAIVEKPGYYPDQVKLDKSLLRPGPWIEEALKLLRQGEPSNTVIQIQGGQFRLGQLVDQTFSASPGGRVAYVTDTAWSEAVQPRLLKLARRAKLLYCDSFYRQAQIRQARKYRHMTATHSAEFAREAKVQQLILIHFSSRYSGRYEEIVEEARAIFPKVSAEL